MNVFPKWHQLSKKEKKKIEDALRKYIRKQAFVFFA